MRRLDREIVEIGTDMPLSALIDRLRLIHSSLPEDADPAVKAEGDATFGWRLKFSYFREPTIREAELQAKYGSHLHKVSVGPLAATVSRCLPSGSPASAGAVGPLTAALGPDAAPALA